MAVAVGGLGVGAVRVTLVGEGVGHCGVAGIGSRPGEKIEWSGMDPKLGDAVENWLSGLV